MDKLTKTDIKKLKDIAHAVEDMIDFDKSNTLNLIQIFKRLSLKQLDFITNTKIFDESNLSVVGPNKGKLEITKLPNDIQNVMMIAGIQNQLDTLTASINYLEKEASFEALAIIFQAIAPYASIINKTQKFELNSNGTFARPEVVDKPFVRMLKDQIFSAYIENPEIMFPIENKHLRNAVVSMISESYNEEECSYSNFWLGDIIYKLNQYFNNVVDNDMSSKSDIIHQSDMLYNESIDKLYQSTSQFTIFTLNNKSTTTWNGIFNFSRLHDINFMFEPTVPNGLNKKEFYTVIWLKNLTSEYEEKMPSSELISDLAQLIYLQTKERLNNPTVAGTESETKLAELSDAMSAFLKTYNPQVSQSSPNKTLITYKDFREFIDAIETNVQISQKVVDWLVENTNYTPNDNQSSDDDNEFLKRLLSDLNVASSLSFVENKDEKKHLINKICDSHTKVNITNIYKINNQKSNSDYKKDENVEIKHKTLVHGTSNASILTILRDGLLTRSEIKNDAFNTETGLGLGDGIYFAQCHQAGKSLNYTSENNGIRYLFVADVAYSKQKEVSHFGYYDSDDSWDLLYAKAVGSYDRDELVSRTSKQIELKYLLEIHE